MTKTGEKSADPVDLEPWRGLSERVAATIEPELDAVAAETLAAIAREVPEYARPLEGSFGRGIRTGVGEALRQFVALIRDPEGGRGVGREVYVALGRGSCARGGPSTRCRPPTGSAPGSPGGGSPPPARRAGLDPEELSLLAEAIFAYIDELSADSVEGYAEAQAEVEDRAPPPAARAGGDARPRAAAARGRPAGPPPARRAGRRRGRRPRSPAPRPTSGRSRAGCPPDTLATVLDGTGCLLLADPAGPGRREEIERAAGGHTAALGPAGEVAGLRASWSLARTALRAVEAGALPLGRPAGRRGPPRRPRRPGQRRDRRADRGAAPGDR